MRQITGVLIAIAVVFSVTYVHAEDEPILKSHPGYVDVAGLQIPADAGETVEIHLDHRLLGLVAKAAGREDPGLAKLLSRLLLVRVNTFSVDRKTSKAVRQQIVEAESGLQKDKWERIVRVKKPKELMSIHVRMDNGQVVGLVVMGVGKDDQATFVNIVGEIELETVGRLGKKLRVPMLEIPATGE